MGYKKMRWQKPLSDLVDIVIKTIDGMNKEELESLLHACNKVTKTNCGWQEYDMAGIVKNYVEYRLELLETDNLADKV